MKQYTSNMDTFREIVQSPGLDTKNDFQNINPLSDIDSNNYFSSQSRIGNGLTIKTKNFDYSGVSHDNIMSQGIYDQAYDSNKFSGNQYIPTGRPSNNPIPTSPNLFHNPITSGLNSTKNASPMLNNTANFAGFAQYSKMSRQQSHSKEGVQSLKQSNLSTSREAEESHKGSVLQEHKTQLVSLQDNIQKKKNGNIINSNQNGVQQNESHYREKLQNLKATQQKIQENLQLINSEIERKQQFSETLQQNISQQISMHNLLQTNSTSLSPRALINQGQKSPKEQSFQNHNNSTNGAYEQQINMNGLRELSDKKQQQQNFARPEEKLYNDFKERQNRIQQLQQKRFEEEKLKLQQKPTISPKSQKLASQANKNFQQKQEEFVLNRIKMQNQRAQQLEQEEQKELSLHPKINPQSQQMHRGINDLLEWNKNKEQKQLQKRQQKIQEEIDLYVNNNESSQNKEKCDSAFQRRNNTDLQIVSNLSANIDKPLQMMKGQGYIQQPISLQKKSQSRVVSQERPQSNNLSPKNKQNQRNNIIETKRTQSYQQNMQCRSNQNSVGRCGGQMSPKSPLSYQKQQNLNLNQSRESSSKYANRNGISPKSPASQLLRNQRLNNQPKQHMNLLNQVQNSTCSIGGLGTNNINANNSRNLEFNEQRQQQIQKQNPNKEIFPNEKKLMQQLQVKQNTYNGNGVMGMSSYQSLYERLNTINEQSSYSTQQKCFESSTEQICLNSNEIVTNQYRQIQHNPTNTNSYYQYETPQVHSHQISMNLASNTNNNNNNLNTHSQRILDLILDNEKIESKRMSTQTPSLQSSVYSNHPQQPPLSITSLQSTQKVMMPSNQGKQNPIEYQENGASKQLFLNTFKTCSTKNNNYILEQYTQETPGMMDNQNYSSRSINQLKRSELWLNNKNRKIETARDGMKDKDLEGCTFEPKLFQYKPPKHHQNSRQRNQSLTKLTGGSNASVSMKDSISNENVSITQMNYQQTTGLKNNQMQKIGKKSQSINRQNQGYSKNQKEIEGGVGNNSNAGSYVQIHNKKCNFRSRSLDSGGTSRPASSLSNHSMTSSQRRLNTDGMSSEECNYKGGSSRVTMNGLSISGQMQKAQIPRSNEKLLNPQLLCKNQNPSYQNKIQQNFQNSINQNDIVPPSPYQASECSNLKSEHQIYYSDYKNILDQFYLPADLSINQDKSSKDPSAILSEDVPIPNKVVKLYEYTEAHQQLKQQLDPIIEEHSAQLSPSYSTFDQSKQNTQESITQNNNQIQHFEINQQTNQQIVVQQFNKTQKPKQNSAHNYVPLSQRIAQYANQYNKENQQNSHSEIQYQKQTNSSSIDSQGNQPIKIYSPSETDMQVKLANDQNEIKYNQSTQLKHLKGLVNQQQYQRDDNKFINMNEGSNTSQLFKLPSNLENKQTYNCPSEQNNIYLSNNNAGGTNASEFEKIGNNTDKFREKLNKAKETLARIREANKL